MLPRHCFLLSAILLMISAGACSILKKDNAEKDVRVFLTSFQNSLTKTDPEILTLFETRQTEDAILSVIHILQNKAHSFIVCSAGFDQAQITPEEGDIKVVVPASLKPKQGGEDHQEASIVFWLKPKNNTYVITRIEGDEFYKAFADIRNSIQYGVEGKLEMRKREPIYAMAKVIQLDYDSVIWYAAYQDKLYFYVVKGTWDNYFTSYGAKQENHDYAMGLTDDRGQIIIPLEYELIGTLGFSTPGIVEIKKHGKVGYFDIVTRQLVIQPQFDIILPYAQGEAMAIVKTDSVYGWIDKQHQLHDGFPSDNAKRWVMTFDFLPRDLRLKNDTKTLCEIPNEENAGYGIVMPPSYLVKTGIFREIIGGITTTPVPLNGWTDYVETSQTLLQAVTAKINAVVTTITERYIDGREEFYTQNRIAFVNDGNDTLAVSTIPSDSIYYIKRMDTTLLEIKSRAPYYFYEGDVDWDYDVPLYSYFRLGEDLTVQKLETNRVFDQTAFVKLDSSYLMGSFSRWDSVSRTQIPTTFLSVPMLSYMRNEILASYGLKFSEPAITRNFSTDWYQPRFDKIEEFADQLSDIDRYNLDFLEKIISLLQDKPV